MFCFVVSVMVLNWISLLLVVMIYLAVHFMWFGGVDFRCLVWCFAAGGFRGCVSGGSVAP